MRKFGICALVVMVSLGVVVLLGGCGGGSSDGLPKSSSSYAGSNNPAVIDSTTAAQYFELPSGLIEILGELSLFEAEPAAVLYDETDTIEGSGGGTLTIWERAEETETSTSYFAKEQLRYTFDNYVDDGEQFYGVKLGSGSAYLMDQFRVTFPEEPVEPLGPEYYTWDELQHQNFSAFYFSDEVDEQERSGWMTMEFNEVVPLWDAQLGADISLTDYQYDFTIGLLGAEGGMSWDGDYTTYAASGTICMEGEGAPEAIGCFDFDFNFRWDQDTGGDIIPVYPVDGYMEITNTLDASVMFEFGYTTTSPCPLVSLDADGDGVYEWSEQYCGFE